MSTATVTCLIEGDRQLGRQRGQVLHPKAGPGGPCRDPAAAVPTSSASTDTGPGISEHERDAVLRRFYRSDKRSENTPGVGLGLNLVAAIREAFTAFPVHDQVRRRMRRGDCLS